MVDVSDIEQALSVLDRDEKSTKLTANKPGSKKSFDITAAADDIAEDVSMTI